MPSARQAGVRTASVRCCDISGPSPQHRVRGADDIGPESVPPQRHACVYHVDAIEEGSSRTVTSARHHIVNFVDLVRGPEAIYQFRPLTRA
jgi:hypothetical protein